MVVIYFRLELPPSIYRNDRIIELLLLWPQCFKKITQSLATAKLYWISLDCAGAPNKLSIGFTFYPKSLWNQSNFSRAIMSKNENFLAAEWTVWAGLFLWQELENRGIIQSGDPVTPEEDHMLGRTAAVKRLWSSASRKPLATAFLQERRLAESSHCVLIAESDYMMARHWNICCSVQARLYWIYIAQCLWHLNNQWKQIIFLWLIILLHLGRPLLQKKQA